jgi:arylsulfatase A-like enzyme
LLEDLHLRGLLDETLVVAMGEFGRSPKVNPWAGRDHWPRCYSVFLAGGGVRGGYVHGKSGKFGEDPSEDPVTPHDVVATLYTLLGIPPQTELPDNLGRPVRLHGPGKAIQGVMA